MRITNSRGVRRISFRQELDGERGSEPIMGVRELCPQLVPGAEHLVSGQRRFES